MMTPVPIEIHLTQEDIDRLVREVITREVKVCVPRDNYLHRLIHAEVLGITRDVIGDILRKEMPGIVGDWLSAREGWMAKIVTRALLRRAEHVPD